MHRAATWTELVTLESPHFRFVLNVTKGLRTVSWENRITGRTLRLGDGPEIELEMGLPDQPVRKPTLTVESLPSEGSGPDGEATPDSRG